MKKSFIHCNIFRFEFLGCDCLDSRFRGTGSRTGNFSYPLLFSFFLLLCSCSGKYTDTPLCTPEEKQTIAQSFLSKVESDTNQKLEKVIHNTGLNRDQKQAQISEVIKKIEPQIRSSFDISRVKSKTCRFSYNENSIQDSTVELEQKARAKVKKWWDSQIGQSQESLSQQEGAFIQTVVESHSLVNRVNVEEGAEAPSAGGTSAKPALPTSEESSETDFETAVREVLETKYARYELGAVYEDAPLKQGDIPYQFKSSEGEFLEKSKALYDKLYQANPYHEQGITARDIGLSAVETADAEFAQGNKESAELTYQIGGKMSDIAFGVLPNVGLAKDVYEAFVGRHLLTGRSLSAFERSLSVAGIVLSEVTAGALSAGAIKTSLKNTNAVLEKINQKLLDNNLKVLSGAVLEKIMHTYPPAVLNALSDAGLKTSAGLKSGLKFLSRAFSRQTPRVEDVTKTLRLVGKEGIEVYGRSVDKLSELPIAGEEFLARLVRFSKAIKGEPFSQEELVKTGHTYIVFYKAMDKVKPALVEEKVWRALQKSGYNRLRLR